MLQQDSENDTPVGDSAQEHEYMPDGVIMRLFVVCIEVGACSVENTLADEKCQ